MSTIENKTGTELANIEQNEPSQLITLKPEKYVAEVFSPFRMQLRKAIKEASCVQYDITTKAGMDSAKKLRKLFKDIRTTAENARKERKAPIIEIGKLLDSKYRELEAEISPHEDKFDADIKAEEKRIEDEKQRLIALEKARVDAIENRLAAIRNIPTSMMNASSADIQAKIDFLGNYELDLDLYDEFLDDAINAKNAAIVSLQQVHKQAVDREAAEAKAAAERAELERLRAEREQREKEDAERRAKEAAERAAEEKRRQEELAAKDREMEEMRRQLAALKAAANPAPAPAIVEQAPIAQTPDEVQESAPAVDEVQAEQPRIHLMPGAKLRPTDAEIITALAECFVVDRPTVIGWLRNMDLEDVAA